MENLFHFPCAFAKNTVKFLAFNSTSQDSHTKQQACICPTKHKQSEPNIPFNNNLIQKCKLRRCKK